LLLSLSVETTSIVPVQMDRRMNIAEKGGKKGEVAYRQRRREIKS
jgi:hypothetical protein